MFSEKKITQQLQFKQRMLVGWAYDPFQSALTITLSDSQGKQLVKISADTWLTPAEQIETGLEFPVACGFRLPIPASVCDGQAHSLTLAVVEWKLPMDPKPITINFTAPKEWVMPTEAPTPAIKMIGHVDGISSSKLSGFILDANNPSGMLHALLLVDHVPIMRLRPNHNRPDVMKELMLDEKASGIWGFSVPTPVCLKDGKTHQVRIICQETGETLQNGEQQVQFAPVGQAVGLAAPMPLACKQPVTSTPLVSIVVLNRNGEKPLADLFESWCRHNSVAVEWIVIDHASTDSSKELIQQWSQRLPITLIALDYNNSFSASCNLGAQQAKAPYVLFLNNDIVWLQDALPAMVQSLVDQPNVGWVGLKLITQDEGWIEETQHLGIRFGLYGHQYWPYEVSPLTDRQALTHAPEVHPAVTGAVMLCRKVDFDTLGGFDERYFYGFEDVDIGLRMWRDLGKVSLCRNDRVALHRHGYTRLTGREKQVFNRQAHNSALLEKHWGLWLKQQMRAHKFAHNPIWSRRQLLGVMLLDAPDSEQGKVQFQQAAQVVRRLNAMNVQIEWRMLLSYDPLEPLDDIDVLIVWSEQADVRRAEALSADSLRVAVVSDQQALDRWQKQPWWGYFDQHIESQQLLSHLEAYWRSWSRQLRVLIRVPLTSIKEEPQQVASVAAQSLASRLRQQGVSVRVADHTNTFAGKFVYDVVVHCYSAQLTAPTVLVADAVNVLWLLDAATDLSSAYLDRYDALWHACAVSNAHDERKCCLPWQDEQLKLNPHQNGQQGTRCYIDLRALGDIECVTELPDHYAPSLGRFPAEDKAYEHLELIQTATEGELYWSHWLAWATRRGMSVSFNHQPLSGVFVQSPRVSLVTQLKQLVESRCGYSVYSS